MKKIFLPTLLSWGMFMVAVEAAVRINEIVSKNGPDGFLAADGQAYDWIELHNDGAEKVDLIDWHLTDEQAQLTRWKFTRNFVIPAGGYAVIFASSLNDLIEGQEHLNFKLDAGDGEYLALVAPDGTTVIDEFSPYFPPLNAGLSYGIPDGGEEAVVLLSTSPLGENTGAAPVPVIHSFTASKNPIDFGEQISLSWETERGTQVTLQSSSDQSTKVAAIGSSLVRPPLGLTYFLVASNEFATNREPLEILVKPAVTTFSATPEVIATGGQTVLRWTTEGSNSHIVLDGNTRPFLSSPALFTPSNETLIESGGGWKIAPENRGEGWANPDFDDSAWKLVQAPFIGKNSYRKTFQVGDPSALVSYRLRIFSTGGFVALINGKRLLPHNYWYNQPGGPGEFRLDPTDLVAGANLLAIVTAADVVPYDFELAAWRPLAVDAVVPITLTTSNDAGEVSETVHVTVLAESTPLPPLPTLAISEFFWAYFGTFPIEPYRFFEVENCGPEALDLTGIQFVGSSTYAFADSVDPILASGSHGLVVNDHAAFSQIWPGDRNVLGQFEDPDPAETYNFSLEEGLLDPYGREIEYMSSVFLPEYGDIYQPLERIDSKASSTDPDNWGFNDYQFSGEELGTPGEATFHILDLSFDPPFASPGDTVNIQWEVSREVPMTLSNGIGEIFGRAGSLELKVPEDAREFRFTLEAQTTFGKFDRQALLILPPSIAYFRSDKRAVSPGEEVTFYWKQSIPYVGSGISISPELPTGIYGWKHTFTPLISGFKPGDFWYHFAHKNGPEANWTSPDFAEFQSWRGRRGIQGFGSGLVPTPLIPKDWLTSYFRRRFDVPDVEEINGLFLDLLVDDGVEIHLNGHEILRDNLPEGEIDHNTPALAASPDNGTVYRTFEINPDFLVEGQNTISVGVHNLAVDDDDLVFDLGLRAQRPVPASGRKIYTLTSQNDAGVQTAQLTLLFKEPTTLEDWMTLHGLEGDPVAGDQDGDGLNDLIEFASGSDPNSPSPQPLKTLINSEGGLTFTYPHDLAAGGTRVYLESSPDLINWTAQPNLVFVGSVAPDGSDIAQVTVRTYAPIRSTKFFRLRAQ